jgi:twinkle protein
MKPLEPDTIAWFQSRGISQATLELASVGDGTTYFSDLNAKSRAAFYKYREGWKARSFPEKAFTAGGGFKPTFWGLDEVLEARPNVVMIVEGENDRLALIEAGIPPGQVLAAPSASTGLDYAHNALQEGLGSAQRFVWCGDSDEAGIRLRGELIKIVGAARFYHVEWPDGIKDPNDMLIKEGPEALRDLVLNGALPWPQEGLFRLSELPTPPPLTIWKPSIPGFDGRIHFAPSTLSVVTGQPGHGKTQCFNQIWYEIAKNHGITCCIASFETGPKPYIRRQLRTLLTGKLEIEMDDRELAQADAWIESHYLFLMHPEHRPTLEWFLDCAETAVVRHGARMVQLDPWNRLEAMRLPRENETEYVLRCLRALYVFAKDMNCHVQVVAHPAKMDGPRRNQPPSLEDISGSKHFENIVDQGFVIHRPQMFDGTERKTETAFYHRKARYEDIGFPCKIMLNYDLSTRKYVPLSDGLTAQDFD